MSESTGLRVLIVDDEPLARQRIADALATHADVEIVGEAGDGDAAAEAIQTTKPDVVFLDMQMPGKTGLEVVRQVGIAQMPLTIFVTAYDKHALEAFEVAAVDYLVKPFDDDRFDQALGRARRIIELKEVDRLRSRLLTILQGSEGDRSSDRALPSPTARGDYLERIPVEMRGKVRVVPVGEIDFIIASGPYAELYSGDRKYVIRESMQNLEDRLDPAHFIRTHRSVIVRLELIETLHKGAGGDYEVQLKSGRRLRVSRSRIEALERKLGLGA
ncbi:MAG TPA: LytTR family DNA-binding domain-containing protein [Gemmatimonadaceae bacterium]|nr:LytTR family DNA-binding domain-containing protein [Gemmatimonadaceae bacterium]